MSSTSDDKCGDIAGIVLLMRYNDSAKNQFQVDLGVIQVYE